jgi:SNF2 family DNA or RNA helicase
MTSHTFIDFVSTQFQASNWQNGISIYRSGGIHNFQAYGELISCKVKAGIGENYEVRIKIHSLGKFIQWMECTCQANRRRAEKCPHLAAFCIYLDQEKAPYLQKMNLGAGGSDLHLNPINFQKATQQNTSNNKNSAFSPQEKWDIINDAKQIIESNNLENIFSSAIEIISIDLDKEEPWLNITVKIDSSKIINYRFSIDDTCKILFNSKYLNKISPKALQLIDHKYTAKRYFNITLSGKSGFKIEKFIDIFQENKLFKKIAISDLAHNHNGKVGIYLKKIGYIPFCDNLNITQISRWQEYPKVGIVEGDTAANLLENNFSRLKETTEVITSHNLTKIKVYDKITVPEFTLNKSPDGDILIEAQFKSDSKTDAQYDKNLPQASGSLLQILKARAEGKQFLETEKGYIKITSEIDWLKNKIQDDGQIKLSTLEFIKFHEQFGANSKVKGKKAFIQKIRSGLISRENLQSPVLKETNLKLRPYQEDGLKWLWWLYNNQLGGLLADEMGLGKTHQAMGLISGISESETSSITLIVCPTSVIDHWLDKMHKYIPKINSICFHGSLRKNHLNKINNNKDHHYAFVTSYGILLRDINLIMQFKWNLVILDEAHLVKNQSTRTYKAACKINSNMRLCLTGTPLENDLMELKNLFDYIAPKYLGTDNDFKKRYLPNTEKIDPLADIELHRLIHPFKMRRNKIDVLRDLPDKVEDIRYCHLNPSQKKLYTEALNLKGKKLIDDLQNDKNPIPYIHIFSLISLLKQICNDPSLIDPQYGTVGSGKLHLFDELLSEAIESEQKVVVFSQYAKMVNKLSERLNLQGIKHVTLTGQSINRGNIVREFQENKDVKVFIGSLLAGGTGIDLTAGSVVIHFDRWWNAAKENQATDRIHRIGQTRNVQVYKLITKGTLEERIDEIISRKKSIFERFVEQDEEVFKHLSRDDLLQLLKAPTDSLDLDIQEEDSFEIYDF